MLKEKRYLILEDGTVYEGYPFGSKVVKSGELVFNTSMFGFQEIITDASYAGQIVTFSFPLVGNTGFNNEDSETMNPSIAGIVVREEALTPSNFRTNETLHDYLERHNIAGISGIDTRSIVRKIRDGGTQRAIITDDSNIDEALKSLNDTGETRDKVQSTSTKNAYISTGVGHRVVLLDLGKQESVVRSLNSAGCEVTVVPFHTSSEEILRMKPDGVLISNGPGSSEDIPEVVETVKELLPHVKMFGVGLGHQAIAQACGATISKLPFGHRGSNIPVKDLQTHKVEITSQNHGYVVDMDSVSDTALKVTHVSLNDNTVEGLEHSEYPVFSVQFYPGAIDGPDDSSYVLKKFISLMDEEDNNA